MRKLNNSLEVVEGFFKAINKGNFNEAKTFMLDNHYYFGLMFLTGNPEEYFDTALFPKP